VPIEELSAIEGFDDDVANELRERARQFLEQKEAELTETRKKAGVSDDVADVEGLTGEMVVLLGENEVKSLDDLADLASDELREIVGEANLSEEAANEIIMAARAHWFEDEDAPAESDEAGGDEANEDAGDAGDAATKTPEETSEDSPEETPEASEKKSEENSDA